MTREAVGWNAVVARPPASSWVEGQDRGQPVGGPEGRDPGRAAARAPGR